MVCGWHEFAERANGDVNFVICIVVRVGQWSAAARTEAASCAWRRAETGRFAAHDSKRGFGHRQPRDGRGCADPSAGRAMAARSIECEAVRFVTDETAVAMPFDHGVRPKQRSCLNSPPKAA